MARIWQLSCTNSILWLINRDLKVPISHPTSFHGAGVLSGPSGIIIGGLPREAEDYLPLVTKQTPRTSRRFTYPRCG